MERAARSKQPPQEQDHNPKPPPRPATGTKPAVAQGARPRDGL